MFFDTSNYGNLLNSRNTNPYQSEHCKIYFAGPASETSTYQEREYRKPGKDYNPSKISAAGLSKYSTTNRLGISGDGWEHNLQLALVSTINLIIDNLKRRPQQKITINIPAAYSRGGATAIAFSNLLSEKLENMGISSDKASIEQIHAIDPVAGIDYGKLKESIKRPQYQNDLASVSPLRVGSYTGSLDLHIATQERRKAFKPQLPYGLDKKFKNNRPLFIPDSVETTIRLSHACHQTIAYLEYLNERCYFPSACETYKRITKETFQTAKQEDSTWRHLGNDSNNIIYPKEDRCVQKTTTTTKPERTIKYTNSVLYDVYHYFMENSNGDNTFQQALADPNNKYNDLIVWAYKNSNFYRVTKLEPSSFNDETSSHVLSQAVQCKTREGLALLAMQYKHYQRYDIPVTAVKLDHQALERTISLPPEKQKDYLRKQLTFNSSSLDKSKQIALRAINNAMIHLRASSSDKKVYKLKATKTLIQQARSPQQCAKLLYLAERVVQHNMGTFHFRLKTNYSKDYHALDFEEAKNHFGKEGFRRGQEYRTYNNTAITFANFLSIANSSKRDSSLNLDH